MVRTKNLPVIPVTDAAAPGGSWSWYFPWRCKAGLRSNSPYWNYRCVDTSRLLHCCRLVTKSPLRINYCPRAPLVPSDTSPCTSLAGDKAKVLLGVVMMLSAVLYSSNRCSKVQIMVSDSSQKKNQTPLSVGICIIIKLSIVEVPVHTSRHLQLSETSLTLLLPSKLMIPQCECPFISDRTPLQSHGESPWSQGGACLERVHLTLQ